MTTLMIFGIGLIIYVAAVLAFLIASDLSDGERHGATKASNAPEFIPDAAEARAYLIRRDAA
jgi:hypothetical protein